MTEAPPPVLRLGAYATIVRDSQVLLSRLASFVTPEELWTLPGGGVEHGEDPRDAVVREVHEETGLIVTVGDDVRVDSVHRPARTGFDGRLIDSHAVRLVYHGWVAPDAPTPRVVEVGGSTMDAAWHPLSAVVAGTVPVDPLVRFALDGHVTARLQRIAVYGLLTRRGDDGDEVLLTRVSRLGHHAGSWTLPGGGVEHGEHPSDALVREIDEECGLVATVGDVLGVHDVHFTGTAPNGRTEDFHGVQVVYAAHAPAVVPRVTEVGGTTDEVAWWPISQVVAGRVPVLDVVSFALRASR